MKGALRQRTHEQNKRIHTETEKKKLHETIKRPWRTSADGLNKRQEQVTSEKLPQCHRNSFLRCGPIGYQELTWSK